MPPAPSVYLFAVIEPEAGEASAPPSDRPRRPPSREGSPRRFGPPQNERQKRFRQRTIPLIIVAVVSFVVGVIVAAGSPERDLASGFVKDWANQNFNAMYADLNDDSQARYRLDRFTADYQEAQAAATATAIDPGDAHGPHDVNGTKVVDVDVTVTTKLFGEVSGQVSIPIDGGNIAWNPSLTFPGLATGERLGRRIILAKRASILARDGTPLADGGSEVRSSPLGADAIDVAGEVGTPDAKLKQKIEQQGYPGDRPTGVSGLELAFNQRLAGTPGGKLLAVPNGTELPDVPVGTRGRVLARAEPIEGREVKTTIDRDLQQLTVSALGGQAGGAVVLDPQSGAVRALAGSAYLSPQPPGSTFKIVTTTAGLEEGLVKLDRYYTPVSEINAGGRVISNDNNEVCGGTFVEAFAKSCNTVFAPLGVEIGKKPLVHTAERYGWNSKPSLYNARAMAAIDPPAPSIPKPRNLGTDVDLAASAIGQGRVLATPLQMAEVAQTIANGGVRKPNPIVTEPHLRSTAKAVRVTSKENTRVVRGLMEEVVNSGTGIRAQLPGIQVAGKTGTAELGPKPGAPAPPPGQQPEQVIDAWFTCFAPADHPKLVVAVMLIDASADGGTVAAPIAHDILASALG
jgi:peptidoglycan glycosyltransferase